MTATETAVGPEAPLAADLHLPARSKPLGRALDILVRSIVPVLLALVAGASFFMAASYAPMFGIWAALVPASALGVTFGAGNTVSFVGSLVAPPLTGWIRDTTGSFAAGFLVSAALLLGGTLLVMAVRPAFRLRNEERTG